GCTTDWNPPFKGWVDEFKVYALTANDLANTFGFYDELVCNQALGTLVDPSEQVGEGFNKYLGVMRNRIGLYGYTYAGSGVAGKPVLGAFCEQLDLAADGGQGELPRQHDNPSLCANRVHKNQTSNRCLRGVKLGLTPIQAAAQLPSFSADKFCLGCHHVDSPIQGLRLPALAAGVVPSQEDPRRRPLFWPGAVTGDQHADPWLLQGRLAGWGVCDSNPNVPNTCTALDQTFDPGNQKWHFQ
ncbi:MAG: hypothetical protein ABI193_26555, partial [Minicystis sp.]